MKILFVCSGNTCRSPMAEGYLKSLNIKGLEVASAGLSVGEYATVSENSSLAMREIGIDISSHIPRQITMGMINSADKIICMTATHKALLELSGVNADISVLGFGISDPYGQDEDAYILCRREITNEIDKLLEKMTVRPYKKGDEKAIAEIEKECFESPWSENAVLSSIDSGDIFLVLQRGFSVIGYVGLKAVLDEGYINNIAIKKEYRRLGGASLLLKELIKKAEELNLAFISLEVRVSNEKAISLYEKFGFETKGIRKNFYENPKEDAIIMTKTMRD